ncbi:hypothetical protein BU25DRAFT_65454 [Macroventuria anomochaeta]|uniref:Uncharacterized protein n=1 Tax=Macroventuria anomochaeta TaxID=301207 RepID=A0ACB6S235_9PLEO|nr:uncharacterized protein BU25DRAFT_65454 [Macroventuria anomochaeta]KAF2627458.1 hypothetical protein BU25DRAFT_65454 [Macroventuria anomochaeta]
MSTKPQSPDPSTALAKQSRSRKAANPDPTTAGRPGSAGGVVLEKEAAKKSSPSQPKDQSKDAPPKRKPRKLNKEPTSTPTALTSSLSNEAAELEALKSRVRGLEAKVEDLYKSTPSAGSAAPRSPRRRGKGRKNSSTTTTATLGNLSRQKEDQQAQVTELDDEDADEELVRLESELEVARQDLALYNPTAQSRPRARRSASEDTEYVEEIPRDRPGVSVGSDRQVTLSGSYRIPLPANLNPEDVKTIQSGVSAAQNVARSFLDQRRANQALRNAREDAGPPPTAKAKAKAPSKAPPASMEVSAVEEGGGGKQSWGEWIGGYSMAISRAVKNIEHEAAMEAQSAESQRPGQTSRSKATGAKKKKERPAAKTTLSGEQVQGLMS